MNKKQQKKLEELKIELDAYVLMSQLVLSMMVKVVFTRSGVVVLGESDG